MILTQRRERAIWMGGLCLLISNYLSPVAREPVESKASPLMRAWLEVVQAPRHRCEKAMTKASQNNTCKVLTAVLRTQSFH